MFEQTEAALVMTLLALGGIALMADESIETTCMQMVKWLRTRGRRKPALFFNYFRNSTMATVSRSQYRRSASSICAFSIQSLTVKIIRAYSQAATPPSPIARSA